MSRERERCININRKQESLAAQEVQRMREERRKEREHEVQQEYIWEITHHDSLPLRRLTLRFLHRTQHVVNT